MTRSSAAICATVSTEAPAAPILLSTYAHGLAGGRIELSPQAAVQLAADLLAHAVPKLASAGGEAALT